MNNEPEFIRGNQKSYIRISCEESLLECYEYQMCVYNHIGSFLEFQQRSENGNLYLHYEISGMQSLDIYLQTHKLKRSFAIQLLNALLKLSREISEYALDLEKILFTPKYIMVTPEEELRFVYNFVEGKNSAEFERLLEAGIDHMDYQDELLMKKMFEFYERSLEQKNNFLLEKEVLELRDSLIEVQDVENVDERSSNFEVGWKTEDGVVQKEDTILGLEKKNRKGKIKKEILVVLVLDFLLVIFWKPLTILKISFAIAVWIVMAVLNCRSYKKDKVEMEANVCLEKEAVFMEEYENLMGKNVEENNYTQLIEIEEPEGVLYSLQEREPKYIYINETQKILGKDPEKAHIVVGYEGISRLHAIVVKEGKACLVEDLNSTNGTKLNEEVLAPRKRYVLQQGDKVSFAGVDYIFR